MTYKRAAAWQRALLGSAALLGFAQPLQAQDQMPAQAPQDAAEESGGDVIIVTGSRIARRDLTSSSPLAVVSAEEFKLAGSVNVEQVLNTLPQVIPGATAFSNNPGGGAATLDLRGLGQQRTLVLVNGRRYMFFSPLQTVDLNTIPQALIANVDVVTGGASAVYGSDAIAGVVNFRLREDLRGLQLGGQYSLTGKGDGARWNLNAALGTEFADGAGHVTLFADYLKRKAVMGDARSFSSVIYNDNATKTGYVAGGSSTVPGGRFQINSTPAAIPAGNGMPAVSLPTGVGNFTASPLGAIYTAPGQSRAYVGSDAYNFAPDNFLQAPQERWLIGAYGKYERSAAFNPYFELTFANNRVDNELAPTPVTGTFAIATDNPFLSATDRAALQQTDANEAAIDAARVARGLAPTFNTPGFVNVSVNRRVNDLTSRRSLFERNAWRVVAGFEGEIAPKLTYDAYYLYSRALTTNLQEGNVSRSAFAAELRANRLNIFGPNTITADQANRIAIRATNTTVSELQVASGSLSGSFGGLGMGGDDVGFAFGAEWRSMGSEFIPDTALSSGDVIGFNAALPTKGNYSTKEVFGELLVPIVADRPFFNNLTLRGAARYADYTLDKVGGTFTWAAGGEWSPVRDITFRAQYQRAIRAPSVAELFGGQGQSFPAATDPCSSRAAAALQTAEVRALCVATGVPSALVFSGSVQPNAQIQSLVGGNPDLSEETSNTLTLGAIFRPSFLPGFNLTVDYYNIKVDDYIAFFGGGTDNLLRVCYYGVKDANNAYCKAISRDPGTGQIVAPYFVTTLAANIATLKTEGIDVQADYATRLGFGVFGEESKLSLFALATFLTKADFTPVADRPGDVNRCKGAYGTTCTGIFGDPTPEFRMSARASWVDGPLTTSIKLRHLGSVTLENVIAGSDPAGFTLSKLKPKTYVDLSFAYNINETFGISLGMNNVFNVKPQIINDANDEQSSTYPSTYDPLGRDFFLSATIRL